MAEWHYSSMSVADMVASFPVNKLSPIDGRPSILTLLNALKIFTRCSQKNKSGLGPLRYFFVAQPPCTFNGLPTSHLFSWDQHQLYPSTPSI